MNIYQHTQRVIDTVRKKTNRVLLFYSCGKDSIALLHWCAKNFSEVVCVFMYFVKDLEHINKFINFSKKQYPNISFIQRPHYALTYINKSGLFCTPQNTRILKLSDIIQSVRIETQIEYVFLGMKQSDSMNRRIMLRQYELQAISPTNLVYPFSLWKDKDVLRYISNNRLPKPIQYSNKKSNGITFDLDVYLYLREHYPNDLQKILDVYPLSEKILFDYDQKNKNTKGTIQAK
ncbi:phosphoadenosine phosphosulfate reductase family protein [uncultured Capnocytophaga sp.]|jgi:3'-phosphoadenosine 5'-phosphosulfate sulfotransferase (PAPS reductase)/FAD synthetase|uniref:phosphoadenosine phosphosulfate reductase domain-containing protein n=1 Tax=uncultured Capnocytophaga sp. TaxID=159273 RepID=UPI00259862D1|nr:phosphoadenosine phosphosulfate reductase family protein [uncultured Capnocytophaga sp.]